MDKIEKAKATLKEAGYYVDNLWSIRDVDYNCDDDTKQKILNEALTSPFIIDECFFSIRTEAHSLKLTKTIEE